MARFLYVILFVCLGVAANSQTPIAFPGFIRNNSADTYPIGYDSLTRGGMQVQATTISRDAIPQSMRKRGMLVSVISDGVTYKLLTGTSNLDWVPFGVGAVYTGSNGITLSDSDFRLGGSLTQNTTINSNSFLFGVSGLPVGDTASYDLSVTTGGTFIARPKGQSNVFLSEAISSTPTASGADSLHLNGEINPWPTYSFFGRLSGTLGTQNLTLQNTLDGGTFLNKRNVILANSNNTAIDSGGLIINARLAADTALWVKGPNVLFSGNGLTSFHGSSFFIGSLGLYLSANRFIQFSGSSMVNAYQVPFKVNRQYASQLGAVYLTSGNDTITLGSLIDSNLVKLYQGTFTSRQTGVTGEKFYVTGRGHIWTREMPYSATVDTLVGWKNGILTATLSSQFSGGGGGGLAGGNLGSGYRFYYPPSQGIKTAFSSYGIALDSVTSNQLNFRVDTFLVETRLRGLKIADSLSLVLALTVSDDNLKKVGAALSTNTIFQALTDGATITFTTANGINGRVTLGGNRTLSIPSPQNGKVYAVKVFMDVTGGRTLTLPGGASAVLRTGSGDSTLITGQYDGTNGSWMWFSDLNNTATVPLVIAVTASSSLTLPSYQFNIIEVNATSGAVTLTLPSASAGKGYTIKKVDATANAVNFTTAEGAQSITTQWAGLNIYSNSSNWRINGTF